MMDLTPPGTKEGKKYLNNDTGQSFTLYKDGSGTFFSPGQQSVNFISAEEAIDYLQKLPKLGAKLSDSQQSVIKVLAHSYGLDAFEQHINPNKKIVPFMSIREKTTNQVVFTIRKMNNLYMMYRTEEGGGLQQITSLSNWDSFYTKMEEAFKEYSTAHPPMPTNKEPNELSVEEMEEVDKVVKKFDLNIYAIVAPNTVPVITINTSWGSRVWAVKKFEHMYYVLNAINQDATKWEPLEQFAYFYEALGYLKDLVEHIFGKGQGKLNSQQVGEIMKLATDHNYHTNQKLLSMTPDNHVTYWLEFLDPEGKVQWMVGKDKGWYTVYKVIGNTWDIWSETESYDTMLSELSTYLKGVTPAPEEHNGITPEEYNQIRDAVDSYGTMFTSKYVKEIPGQQTAHVVVTVKEHKIGANNLYITLGAIGNYYMVNGPGGNALFTTGTLTGILHWLHDKLAAIAGAPQNISSDDLAEIIHLLNQSQFSYASPGGGTNENYVYVKGKDYVDVNIKGYVDFTRKRVFGPIRHKPPHLFINWLKTVYMKGELPPDSYEMAARISNGLFQGGFLNNSGQLVPHQKINGIKWLRSYLMTLTGGQVGLAKSKWIVENLSQFLAYVEQHGLPALETDVSDSSGLFGEPATQQPPVGGGEDLELTEEEHKELADIIGYYAPTIKFQIQSDHSMNMWVGNNLSVYKIDKVNGIYRVYIDANSTWFGVENLTDFEATKKFIHALCANLVEILKHTSMDVLSAEPTATPSTDPNKLSLSEVKILKKLAEKLGYTAGSYQKKKKLQEAKKESSYSKVVLSNVKTENWLMITKEDGKYVLSLLDENGGLYKVVKKFDHFGNLVEYIDYYIHAYATGKAGPEDKAKYNPPILTKDQFDWLENVLAIKKPGVLLKQFGNGVVGGYDPSHKVPGSEIGNPLFVIRPSSSGTGYIVQVQTANNGMAADEYPFDNFTTMAEWLAANTDELTQLFINTVQAIEGHLANIFDKLKFVYKGTMPNKVTANPPAWHLYEDDEDQKIFIGTDGSSQAWLKNSANEEVEKHEFASLEELVKYLTIGPSAVTSKKESEWTGDEHLDVIIGDAGFKFVGQEESGDKGKILTFVHPNGVFLRYFTLDNSSSVTFGKYPQQHAKQPSTVAFEDNQDLKEYLSKAIAAKSQGKETFIQPEKEKMTSTELMSGESELQYNKETQDLVAKNLKYLEKNGLADSVHWQYSGEFGHGEIRVLKQNKLLFAIGKKTIGQNSLWYIRQKVADNPQGLYVTYSFIHKDVMLTWIYGNSANLCNWKVIKDAQGFNQGATIATPSQQIQVHKQSPKMPGPQYYPEENITALLKHKGFHGEIQPNGTEWVHHSKFSFTLHTNAISWKSKDVSKEYYLPSEQHEKFLQKALKNVTPLDDDATIEIEFAKAVASREDKLFAKAIGMACKSDPIKYEGDDYEGQDFWEEMEARGFYFDHVDKIWSNADLYQVVAAIQSTEGTDTNFKVWWVANGGIQSAVHISPQSLLTHVGPDGVYDKQQKAQVKPEEPYTPPYPPSGETYKTHDEEANAHLIWLNEHDEKILNAMGFVRVPQENLYYKNNLNDIVKFTDTGKAQFIEYEGTPYVYDSTDFNSIPHCLKFIVLKYSDGPWSSENYNTNINLNNITEINLNDHDTYMLEQLGFKWYEAGKKYVKFYNKGESPKTHPHLPPKKGDDVTEAKKKKPKKNEPEETELIEHYEVVTFYDTGNAIWQLYLEGNDKNNNKDKEIEVYEGTAYQVLKFVWLRWMHQSKVALVGKKPPQPTPAASTAHPSYVGGTITGWESPGVQFPYPIHDKFLNSEFEYSVAAGEYYKKYDVDHPQKEQFWSLVKYNGTKILVSYPFIGNGTFERKEYETENPDTALTGIKKIENAEFGKLVQSESDALKQKDSGYYNAPETWTKFSPYSMVAHPKNIMPENWMTKELEAYGFEWDDYSKMYWYNPPTDDTHIKALLWEAVRFDENGTIVYFYPGSKGERRWFASMDFNEVEHKIEVSHASSHHGQLHPSQKKMVPQQPKANNGKLLSGENYPKAPDMTTNFSANGQALQLVDQDHKAVLGVGFKFLEPSNEYRNTQKQDAFKIFSDGMVWYKLAGTGEGTTNDIEHFFNMLKSKYGPLEWGDVKVSGPELDFYNDKLEKMGFKQVGNLSDTSKWEYVRKMGADKKTTMNVSEKIVIFPNHSMYFYLIDNSTTDWFGICEFDNVKDGINSLEGQGPKGIALVLTPDLDAHMHQRNFIHNPNTGRYESTMQVNGQSISITFYGDGMALMQAIKKTGTGDFDITSEKIFNNFFNAINWASDKDLSAPDDISVAKTIKPVAKETVDKLMTSMGFVSEGTGVLGERYRNKENSKKFMVNLGSGKVICDFEYIYNFETGELRWGQSIFKDWDEFMEWLSKKTVKPPTKGLISFTPHPNEGLPVYPMPMPFSGFNYHGWASGKGHPSKATIALIPQDDKTMHKLGFTRGITNEGALYYRNKKGDVVYFYVDGSGSIIEEGNKIHYSSVQTLMEELWKEAMHVGLQQKSSTQTKKSIYTQEELVKKMIDMGFIMKGAKAPTGAQSSYIAFHRKTPKFLYDATYTPEKNMIEFIKSKAKKNLQGKHDIVEHWSLDVPEAIEKMENLFAFGSVGTVPPKKKKKEILAGTEDMPWSGTDYKQWGKTVMPALGPDKGMALHPTEEDLLDKLGWKKKGDSNLGYTFHNGTQIMIFYPTGKVVYWSDYGKSPTQNWDDPELAIRWLWKNWKEDQMHPNVTGEMPYSGTDYANWWKTYWPNTPPNESISLHPSDTETLETIGFKKENIPSEESSFKIGYHNGKNGEVLYFFAGGQAAYWKNGEGPKYYGNAYNLMKAMWDKYAPFI